ncbi:oogenesis-related [Notolabrus celidotus]|uniref:oogenesis-related n=1 Tax=Notolabrus celidotus TaxID=1203425 RepID=UPI00148F5760|nr:oogenesis-related [Notolabrus celidotus]
MPSETSTDTVEQEQAQNTEDRVVRRDGVFRSVVRGLFWPFGIVVHAYRGFWWVLGFRQPQEKPRLVPLSPVPAARALPAGSGSTGVTRLLLSILPRWVQSALGYPVSSNIGRSLSPEIRVSPTKPCGKGSKRKQDELDEDEDDEDHPTWVEALTQELADDDVPEEDPDYEPSTVETESEEYCSQNNTESDIEVQGKDVVVIEDVNTGLEESPSEAPLAAV